MSSPPETQVVALANTMNTTASACDYGCSLDALEYWTDYAHNLETGKRVIAVIDWSWWDLQFPGHPREKIEALFAASDIQPVYLFAYAVLFDTSGRFQPGSWVRTTALVKLHEHCVFETRNSLYVMVGPGSRGPVDIAIAHSLR